MASTKQVVLWPFWMTENSINYFAISDQYATFIFFYFCSAKLPPAAILDDRKSLLIAFLTISDICATFFLKFVHKIATGGHFGWPKITFDRISHHFRSIRNFLFDFFRKLAAGGHFGWQKITFNNISRHFRLIRNIFFNLKKMAAAAILDF